MSASPETRPRRPASVLLHAPGRLRAFVRRSEAGLVLLAGATGCGAGVTVAGMNLAAQRLREMNAKEASAAFDRTESEALAVVDSLDERRVIGLLTESHTLKRYSDEFDRQRRAMGGESE